MTGSRHRTNCELVSQGGANVAFFDGHCAWLRKDEIYTRDNTGKIVTNDKLWVVLR